MHILLSASLVIGVGSVVQRPDVVLLISDQWRHDWTSFDLPELSTPAFRYVAERGVRFTRAVVPSPLCNPSRASLATGLRYGRHGVADGHKFNELSTNLTTIYELLRDAGVWTMSVGKDDLTLLGDVRGSPCSSSASITCGTKRTSQLGFDAAARCYGKEMGQFFHQPMDPYAESLHDEPGHLFELYRQEAVTSCPDLPNITTNGYFCPNASQLPQDDFIDDWIARRSSQLIREAPKESPLFLQVNYAGPHPPFIATASMMKAVEGKRWPLAHNSSTLDEEIQQVVRSNYAAGIENIESLNQGIIAELQKRGRWNNTYLCILSDHGEMLGDYWDHSPIFEPFGKSCPWQPAVSVPMACMGPGVSSTTPSAQSTWQPRCWTSRVLPCERASTPPP